LGLLFCNSDEKGRNLKNILLNVGVTLCVGGIACGGDEKAPAVSDVDRNRGGSSSVAGRGGTGDEAGAGGYSSSLGPLVTIISPEGLEEPGDGSVLMGAVAEVVCEAVARENGADVDPSGVKLALLDAEGMVLEEQPGTPTATPGEFKTEFQVHPVPTGRIGFSCTAPDNLGQDTTASVQTFIDHGPAITVLTPTAMSSHPVNGAIAVEFSVEPELLADEDAGAALDTVTLKAGGVPIELSEDAGTYAASLNLTDAELFPQTPDGSFPIVIEARNKRAPTAVTATKSYQITIDGDGPEITILSPPHKAVVGGNVKLEFTVSDPAAGVDLSSVSVSVNKEPRYFDIDDGWSVENNKFTYEFDTRTITSALVQLTIAVTAKDKVGNESKGDSASLILNMDNYPPIMDLDPANIRTFNLNDAFCSSSFDPVGEEAKSDLDSAARAGFFRTIAWDVTNVDPDIPTLHFAGVKHDEVQLFVQSSPETATDKLLIDKDGDTFCDEIGILNTNAFAKLDPLTKAGTPWYALDADSPPTASSLGCNTKDGDPPNKLCTDKASDMWQVIEHGTGEPAVYVLSPTPSSRECTGIAWEFAPFVTADGWVCFATRGVDNVGNVGVSRPLRLCVDDPLRAGQPACAISSTIPPSCTDGCTPPPRFGNVRVRH